MSSVGQSLALIKLRSWFRSLYGTFTEELDSMILVGAFQLRILCETILLTEISEVCR